MYHTIANIGTYASGALFRLGPTYLEVYVMGSQYLVAASVSVGAWHHIEYARSASTLRMYLDGIPQGASFNVPTAIPAGALLLGISAHADSYAEYLNGYMDDFRITKGLARHTGPFTPPAAASPTSAVPIYPFIPFDAISPKRWRSVAPPQEAIAGSTLPELGTSEQPAVLSFFDAYNGGFGIVSATVKEKHTPVNTPLRRKVVLIDEASQLVIRATWSDAATGNYEFLGVKESAAYTVLSYDHTGAFRAVVASGLTLANGGLEMIQ